jgi:hypothetical protein
VLSAGLPYSACRMPSGESQHDLVATAWKLRICASPQPIRTSSKSYPDLLRRECRAVGGPSVDGAGDLEEDQRRGAGVGRGGAELVLDSTRLIAGPARHVGDLGRYDLASRSGGGLREGEIIRSVGEFLGNPWNGTLLP